MPGSVAARWQAGTVAVALRDYLGAPDGFSTVGGSDTSSRRGSSVASPLASPPSSPSGAGVTRSAVAGGGEGTSAAGSGTLVDAGAGPGAGALGSEDAAARVGSTARSRTPPGAVPDAPAADPAPPTRESPVSVAGVRGEARAAAEPSQAPIHLCAHVRAPPCVCLCLHACMFPVSCACPLICAVAAAVCVCVCRRAPSRLHPHPPSPSLPASPRSPPPPPPAGAAPPRRAVHHRALPWPGRARVSC
jgi:hypothetical protein